MANKRDTSKQKRARQNRAQRAALENRTAKANEPKRPSRTAPTKSTSSRASAPSRTTPAASGGEEPKGFFARARADRGPRPGDVPVDIDQLEGGWFTQRIQVPGGRQVLTGAILTLVVTFMTAFAKFLPEDGESGDPLTETIFDLFGTWAYVALTVPCLVYVAAAQLTLSPHRRRIWIGGSFAITLIALSGAPFIIYLFPAGFLVYAVWKANRVEGSSRRRSEPDDDADEADDEVDEGA